MACAFSARLRCRERGRLVLVYRDRLVEPRELEDLAVVLVETVGGKMLLLPVRADEQRDEQSDPAAVHVLETLEVQDDHARPRAARRGVRLHKLLLGPGGDLTLDVDDAGGLVDPPYACSGDLLCHFRFSLVTRDRGLLVREQADEVREPGDLEDLAVVI